MTNRPMPPDGYDDNPPLDDSFFARTVLATEEIALLSRAAMEEAAPLRDALSCIVEAHGRRQSLERPIRAARKILSPDRRREMSRG